MLSIWVATLSAGFERITSWYVAFYGTVISEPPWISLKDTTLSFKTIAFTHSSSESANLKTSQNYRLLTIQSQKDFSLLAKIV